MKRIEARFSLIQRVQVCTMIFTCAPIRTASSVKYIREFFAWNSASDCPWERRSGKCRPVPGVGRRGSEIDEPGCAERRSVDVRSISTNRPCFSLTLCSDASLSIIDRPGGYRHSQRSVRVLWFDGVQLLTIYFIFAMAICLLPA